MEEVKSPYDKGPSYYRRYKIQPVNFIIENNLGFVEGNIIKYICRYKYKNGLDDLAKAMHYLQILMEEYSDEN